MDTETKEPLPLLARETGNMGNAKLASCVPGAVSLSLSPPELATHVDPPARQKNLWKEMGGIRLVPRVATRGAPAAKAPQKPRILDNHTNYNAQCALVVCNAPTNDPCSMGADGSEGASLGLRSPAGRRWSSENEHGDRCQNLPSTAIPRNEGGVKPRKIGRFCTWDWRPRPAVAVLLAPWLNNWAAFWSAPLR
ncbi:hypothetical protein NLG97_g1401 [Lecanicillium saksenae]|uniref:Uncharacterized protein n=1 Tax=Lecanicillium saksenae TaxID=468837 RepID=A0ACC1R3V5_9HYPO|nr:hypothetical protein NLG97_g1401 [Lecanicillium saksenae]